MRLAMIGLGRMGASAPTGVLLERYGFPVGKIVERAKLLVAG